MQTTLNYIKMLDDVEKLAKEIIEVLKCERYMVGLAQKFDMREKLAKYINPYSQLIEEQLWVYTLV